jgi:hypothetical protein
MMIISVDKEDLNRQLIRELHDFAEQGLLAQAMANYVQWLASHMDGTDGLKDWINSKRKIYRNSITTSHDRTASNFADLLVGIWTFLEFAVDVGAITPQEGSKRIDAVRQQLVSLLDIQDEDQHEENVAHKFLQNLGHALLAGWCHLADRLTGDTPIAFADECGWRLLPKYDHESNMMTHYRISSGPRVGWYSKEKLKEDIVFVQLESAVAVIDKHFPPLGITSRILKKRLLEYGAIAERDDNVRYDKTIKIEKRPTKALALYADQVLLDAPFRDGDPVLDFGEAPAADDEAAF